MKFIEIIEAITPVSSTTSPAPVGTTSAPGTAMTGNTAAMSDPKLQAANLAKQKQEKEKQKQSIVAQIKAKQDELKMLQQQQQELNKTV